MKTRNPSKKLRYFLGFIVFASIVFSHTNAWAIKIAIFDSGARKHVDLALSFTSYAGHEDPLNHGTEVARLIRQKNPSAQIYMIQVCENINGSLKPSKAAIVKAVKWAIKNNIDIVNMSLVTKYNEEINRIVTEATLEHGILFVAAAGNKSLKSHFATDSNGFITRRKKAVAPAFPSSNPHVISVGGLDENGKIATYSDKNCDVYAKGKILGQEGSSFACARITAEVAHILRIRPTTDKELILSKLNR